MLGMGCVRVPVRPLILRCFGVRVRAVAKRIQVFLGNEIRRVVVGDEDESIEKLDFCGIAPHPVSPARCPFGHPIAVFKRSFDRF